MQPRFFAGAQNDTSKISISQKTALLQSFPIPAFAILPQQTSHYNSLNKIGSKSIPGKKL